MSKKIFHFAIYRQLVEVYQGSVMSRTQVRFWCNMEFNEGRTDARDEKKSERPSTSTTDENVCHAESLIQDNHRIHARDIVQKLNIYTGSARNIVHEKLGNKKTCSR